MAENSDNKEIILKKVHKFENGATLIYARQFISTTTEASIGFRCGAQCDGEQYGLSHLLEHMLSKGVAKEKQKEYQNLILQTDTYDNAITSLDFISTEFNCPSCNLNTIFNIESDILLGEKHFDTKVLENEKKVVLHEYDGCYDKDIYDGFIDEILGISQENLILTSSFINQFKGITDIHQRLLGTAETLKDITPQTLQDYIDKYFVSENMIISVVSDLPYETILDYIQKYYISKVKSNPNNKVEPANFVEQTFTNEHKLVLSHKENAREFNCKVFFKTPKFEKKDSYLYMYLDNVLFNNFTGILMQKLREENGYTYTSYMSSIDFNEDGSNIKRFDILTSPENAIDAIKVFTTVLGKLIKEGISEKDLYNFKLKMLSREERRVIYSYSSYRLFYNAISGKEPFPAPIKLDFENLSVDMVNDYLRKTYGMSNVGIIFDGDINKAQKILTEQELKQIENEIYSNPLGTDYVNVINNFAIEYNNGITPLPTLKEMLQDFNLAEKILHEAFANYVNIKPVPFKNENTKYNKIYKKQFKKALKDFKNKQKHEKYEKNDEEALTM